MTTMATEQTTHQHKPLTIAEAEEALAAACTYIQNLHEQRASMPNARRVAIEAGDGPGLVTARRMLLEMDDLVTGAEIAEAQAEVALAEAKVRDHEDLEHSVVARCQAAKTTYEQESGEHKMTLLLAYEDAQVGVRAMNSYGRTLHKECTEAGERRRQRIAAALAKEGITQ